MLGQVRTSQDKLGQVRTGQDKSGQVRTSQNRSGQVRTSQDRAGQVRLYTGTGNSRLQRLPAKLKGLWPSFKFLVCKLGKPLLTHKGLFTYYVSQKWEVHTTLLPPSFLAKKSVVRSAKNGGSPPGGWHNMWMAPTPYKLPQHYPNNHQNCVKIQNRKSGHLRITEAKTLCTQIYVCLPVNISIFITF